MNKRWLDGILVLILGVGLPILILSLTVDKYDHKPQVNVVPLQTIATVETTIQTDAVSEKKIAVLMNDGNVVNLELEDYITGVVLCEMPANFEVEALKAQAVVARTYTLRRMESNAKHSDCAVCTDPSCCQGYYSVDEYILKGGTEENIDRIHAAVLQTAGEVVVYNGEMIDATYFSCSGGRTEDAQAVWGADVPYLQSVASPGEEKATHYVDTVYFSQEEFANKLQLELSGNWESWFTDIQYTDGGGIESVKICGKQFTGTEIRKRLGLRSTVFTVNVIGGIVTVSTKGFGHRVGMSQYGADAMAVSGSTYIEILKHYYKGVEIVRY